MNTSARKACLVLCLVLLLLVYLSACGTNTPSSATPTPSKFSALPLGKGMDPEPGTDGKPAPLPNGHSESILIAHGVAYVGSDNGSLYAIDTIHGTVRWSYTVGTAVQVFSVDQGVVYATGNSTLYALSAGSGKLLWQYQEQKGISQVVVADGAVYVATAADNHASTLVALQAADGRPLWNSTVDSITPAIMGVVGGVVYASSSSNGPEGLSSSFIYALQTSDGHVLWKAQLGNGAGLAGGIVAANGLVYFATSQDIIYALRPDTGGIVWHAAQPSTPGMPPNATIPVVANGLVYVAGNQGLVAYNGSTGRLVWQYKEPFSGLPMALPPTLANGVVYYSGVRPTIVALRASDGKMIWSYSGQENVFKPLAVVNGMVINSTGPVYALRASDGSLLWRQNIVGSGEGSDAAGPETVGDGVVLIGGENGVVQAIRVIDGKLLWHDAIKELPVQSPPVFSAYIFFASSLSYQQALEIVTSLGLKTFADCQWASWAPSDTTTFFANDHEMAVLATVSSAPLWFTRLAATRGIQMVQPGGPHSCPLMRPGNGPAYLPTSQANTYVQVTFVHTTQYATALNAVNSLGFRLAAPCYEQARAQGKKTTWHSMDQSSTFNQSRTLLLATTSINAVTWQSQLGAVKGVVKVDTSFKAVC